MQEFLIMKEQASKHSTEMFVGYKVYFQGKLCNLLKSQKLEKIWCMHMRYLSNPTNEYFINAQ